MTAPSRHFLRLTPPSLGDNTGHLDRLAKALARQLGARPRVPLALCNQFGRALVAAGWAVTATVAPTPAGPVVVDLAPGDQTDAPPPADWAQRAALAPPGLWGGQGLGLALDLGSTHLAGALVDLANGRQLARRNLMNPQTAVGADILTRIHFAAKPGGLAQLQAMFTGAARELAAALCAQVGRRPDEIVGVCAAGNTTMTHLFLGLEPQSICREPYAPLLNRPAPCWARELDLGLAPEAVVWLLPNVGAYFGGDLVAGIIAAGLHQSPGVRMLIDVGTNAEVVLGSADWLLACAGAAGPALESGVASHGVLAQPGAIQGVRLDPATLAPSLDIIPDAAGHAPQPLGLCGSGLLQLLAQLYLTRAMDMAGRFREPAGPRLVETDEGPAFLLVPASDSAHGRDITLSEVEIDVLLRSKAAMYTILRTVTLEVGLEFGDLERVYVAGAFGQVIDPDTAITLGMLPDLPRERFRTLGNSSLAGCLRLLTDPGSRPDVEAVSDRLTYLELNVNQSLMNRFSAARFIPHTDTARFPSVPAWH